MLLIQALRQQNLYNPGAKNGNTLEVIVTRIDKNSKNAVQAFSKVFNATGKPFTMCFLSSGAPV